MPWQKRYAWNLNNAHEYCRNNRSFLMNDPLCGCFHCGALFHPSEIEEYIVEDTQDEDRDSAICSYCGVDSIIPQSAGFPLNKDFLDAMYRRWFETGCGIRLSIPPGEILLTLDDKEKNFSYEALDPISVSTPDLDQLYQIKYKFKRDGKPHKLAIRFLNRDVEGTIESGERLEALSFYVAGGKTTIGVSGAFGMESEYGYDYSGSYMKDRIELELFPDTKGHNFTFAVAWLKNCTEQTDTQTWLAVDSILR